MKNKDQPLISIGVPVFNGEKTIVRALESLLNQDYPNTEIIISDNASSDSTPEICRKYTEKYPGVKYYRSEDNLGTCWNFNRVFELSCGKYFMWAACDDNRESSFVSECVKKMEQSFNAVLCQAFTVLRIEGRDEALCTLTLDSFKGKIGLIERYQEALKHFPATAMYGIYRSTALHKTQMFKKKIATDLAFIQELSIYGEFIQIPKVLFTYWMREKWNTVHQNYHVFLGKGVKPWWYLPFIILFLDHCKRLMHASVPFYIKFCLYGVLIGHEIRESIIKILIRGCGLFCPKRLKTKLGCTIYWRWMHNPNIKVCCEDLFLEKVIKPRLGWWK